MPTKTYQEILLDEKSNTFITQGQQNNADYNANINNEIERIYLYLGDEGGFLKIWDLTSVFKNSGIEKIKAVTEQKTAYNPFRMEKIDCTVFGD